MADNKHDIFVISGKKKHLEEISAALMPFYAVHAFQDEGHILGALDISRPTAIIVDEFFPPHGGLRFLERLRKLAAFASLPIVYTVKPEERDQTRHAKEMPYLECLTKPYHLSAMLVAISSLINQKIEASWEALLPVQKEALQNTLQSFNSVAELIAEGKELPYKEVQTSCEPLLEAVQTGSYKALLQGVRQHDNYSYVHSLRVATFLSLFGDFLGIKGGDLSILATGGVLHDVGKMLIPHQILNKPGKLTEDEFDLMRSHVAETVSFLKNTPHIPHGVAVMAGQHHEKLDGSGYPHGLKGAELNELARMGAIIDVFSALTDRRVYKDPMSPEKAINIMESMEGHLDQYFLSSFKGLLLDATSDDELL